MDEATRERLRLLDEWIQKEKDPEKVRQLMEESLRILDDVAKNNAREIWGLSTSTVLVFHSRKCELETNCWGHYQEDDSVG